jgi:glycosyl transferase, family 25
MRSSFSDGDADIEQEEPLMHFYVINLARSPDRRIHITTELGKARVDYEMVNGVDVRELDLGDPREVDPVFAASTPRPGEIGCALSHLKVYQKVLDDDHEVACVLEDDVVLPPDLGALTDAVAPHLVGSEVVLLNFHSRDPLRVARAGAVEFPSSRLLVPVVDIDQVGSGGAYLITQEACARMLKTALPAKAVADNWALFKREGAIDRLRCLAPMPVAQNPGLRSTMNHYRVDNLYSKARELIAGSRAPILQQALTLRRQRHYGRYGIGRTQFIEELPSDLPASRRSR